MRYNQHDELQPNHLSIPEPVNTHYTINPEKLDLVILPLVGFDAHGNRLGTGGGYYDRAFSFKHNSQSNTPFMLGLGFSVQQIDLMNPDPWDIKMNGVLTEKQLITF